MPTSPDASAVLGIDPDHSHESVMVQMFGRPGTPGVGDPTMSGFVASYLHQIDHGTLRPMSWWQRELTAATAFAKRIWYRVTGRPGPIPATADEIMRCFPPSRIPVLGFLAKQFGVLVDWHASVPGETWPNRQYAHAATSHGTSDIEVGFYQDETVFERLTEAGRTWSIYVDGVAQVWAYSFAAGEALMARVYNALVANPALFAETLLLITYDEHGGFFDHVPPRAVTTPDGIDDRGNHFDFTLSGVRVPTVVVSPLIPAGFVDPTFYEHAAIPRLVLQQFAPNSKPLTARDADSANPLDHLPLLAAARTDVRTVEVPVRAGAFVAGAEPAVPEFEFEASTHAAAEAGVLPTGSQADRLVRSVSEQFVSEPA